VEVTAGGWYGFPVFFSGLPRVPPLACPALSRQGGAVHRQIAAFHVNTQVTTSSGPIRQIGFKFSPDGHTLYMVDYGKKPQPIKGNLCENVKT
jgi:hypothetical protein